MAGTSPGMTTESLARAALFKIPVQYPAIDPGQRLDVLYRGAFVDLMHGLAEQAELDHRAIAGDEACVRGAAGGGKLGLAARDLLDRGNREIGERAGLGDEHVRVRRLPHDPCLDAVAGGFGEPRLDQLAQARLGVQIVIADVEDGTRLTRNDVEGGVSD